MPLQIRRGTEAQRVDPTINLTLAAGEPLWVESTKKLYIGDGTTLAASLLPVTGFNEEDARDAAASLFTAGTHSNITFTYNDNDNSISAAINLTNYNGVIKASAFNGTLSADDSTILVDAVDSKINLDGTVKGHIVPATNVAYDLGSATNRFRDLYLSGSSIKLGGATITASGSAVELPVGSTVGGVPIGSGGGGGFDGNFTGTFAGAVTGTLTGDVTGSVFGDDSSLLVDAVDNSLHTSALTISENKIISDAGIVAFGDSTNFEELHVYQSYTGSFIRLFGQNDSATGDSSWITVNNGRGTIDTPVASESGDTLSGLLLFGYDGDSYSRSVTVAGRVDGAVVDGKVPGELLVLVQSSTGVAGDQQQMTFNSKGTLSAPVMQPGSFTTVQRDALTPSFGMIIYNTDTNKFQGYQNTSGTTPEWVDLS